MKLYVIRHGQNNWNLKGIIQVQKNKIKYLDYLRIWNYLEIPMSKIYVNIW